ncbi:mitochondrial import inner membrane translocase subunit tim44 [Acrodontium crateriforme]|uniref:Mitochondrial import inner membrane translocase subunit TIM44 n=1 Tax=Acrodontium crateriforme TaxID=150365 RepID=A0AAQ3R945_9PEZI|nr:mitochondrial import inner membrane translocase subunit tim44 [Acrodontium crateriforme]
MSTASFRSVSSRGRLVPKSVSSYGRTAAYRRISSNLRQYSDASLRQSKSVPSALTPPAALRSHFLPSSISISATSVRHVSFKELREERARQKRGEAATPPPRPAAASATKSRSAKEAETPKPAQEPSSAFDEAEAAFAKAKAESERQWAKQRAREEKEAEEEKAKAEAGEGEEGEKKQDKKKKDDEVPEAPHGNKTPWQVFTETLNAEFKANKEWEENTKQLSGKMHDFQQNPNVQRARSAYAKAAEAASSTTGKVFLGTAGAIGKSAAWTWQTPVVKGIRQGAAVVGSGVEKVTRPVRETEAYKNVKDVIDDGSSQRYGGWTEKEERRRKREERDAKSGYKAPETFEEDPDAGLNVTLHKDSAWKESWKNFRDNSPVMQRFFGMGATYRESENPLISTARSVSDRIAGFFAENETAQVIKKFREMDPSFQLEPFLTEMRTYILPEVLEAYVKGDVETLKLWLSAAQFQVYSALMHQYTTAGLQSDGKILDIRGVDILSARILDPGDIPVFVIMCRTQEVHVYRNKKSGELAAGMEDKVQQVTYAIGVTRIPEDVSNPETRGWKLIELQKSARDYV